MILIKLPWPSHPLACKAPLQNPHPHIETHIVIYECLVNEVVKRTVTSERPFPLEEMLARVAQLKTMKFLDIPGFNTITF